MLRRPRALAPLHTAVTLTLLASPLLRADTHYFIGPPGSLYSDPAHWSTSPDGPPNLPPAAGDDALVSPPSSSPFSLTLDASPNSVFLGRASFSSPDSPLTVHALLTQPFQANRIAIGPNVDFHHSAGNITGVAVVSNGFISIDGPSTTYTLSGTAALAAPGVAIGAAGPATFVQTGGSLNSISYSAGLTLHPGSTVLQSGGSVHTFVQYRIAGNYLLSGGFLSADDLRLDGPSPLTFTHSGGHASATTELFVGRNATYSLSGTGHLSIIDTLRIGGAVRHDPVPANTGSTFTQSGGTVTLDPILGQSIRIDSTTPASSASYLLSAGTIDLNRKRLIVGYDTTGTFVHSGGAILRGLVTHVGYAPGSTGTYSLSGTTATLAPDALVVGYEGNGTFSQSGGSVALNGNDSVLQLASNTGSSATYTLSAGSLTATTARIADAGHATFSQSGGSATFNSFTLANTPSSSATLNLTGGTFSANPAPRDPVSYIAYGGTATVNHSAGTLSVISKLLVLASQPGSQATYSLSGDARLTARGLTVGEQGSATFVQTGGSIYLPAISISSIGPTSSYSLSGTGQLRTFTADVLGSFSQSGGVHFSDTLQVRGHYSLHNGEILAGGTTLAGGSFTQTGGTFFSGEYPGLRLRDHARYSLAGGSLNVEGETSIGQPDAPATFINTGGTHTTRFASPVNLVNGSYSLSGTGVLHTIDTYVRVGSPASPTFAQSGGSLVGQVFLGQAASDIGTYSLTAGQATLYELYVGLAGHGTVLQTGGTISSVRNFVLAEQPNSTGTYTLSAGSLSARDAYVGGSPSSPGGAGSLLLSGTGSLSLTGTLKVWPTPNSAARITGGSLYAASLDLSSPHALDLTAGTLSLPLSHAPDLRAHLLASHVSSSAPDPQDTLSLGYAPASPDSPTPRLSVHLTPTGDANLDGALTLEDYTFLAQGLATNGEFWWQGDFNYDGQVNQHDYLLLDRAYFLTKAQGWQSLGPNFLAQREAQFGPDYVQQLLTSIPEPSLPAILLFALPLLPPRRPTRNHK